MKTIYKIILFALTVLFIGYGITTITNSEEVEIVDNNKAETIIELMGTETSFAVKGNCKMCKKTIETSALSLDGVHKADWNVKTKKIDQVGNHKSTLNTLLKSHYFGVYTLYFNFDKVWTFHFIDLLFFYQKSSPWSPVLLPSIFVKLPSF